MSQSKRLQFGSHEAMMKHSVPETLCLNTLDVLLWVEHTILQKRERETIRHEHSTTTFRLVKRNLSKIVIASAHPV